MKKRRKTFFVRCLRKPRKPRKFPKLFKFFITILLIIGMVIIEEMDGLPKKIVAVFFLIFFVIFFLSMRFCGKYLLIDRISKTILKSSYKIFGWPISSQSLDIDILEIAMIPVAVYSDNLWHIFFRIYGGKDFFQVKENNEYSMNSYERLMTDSAHFKKTEKKMREIAKWLSVPVSIHWWSESFLRNNLEELNCREFLKNIEVPAKDEGELDLSTVKSVFDITVSKNIVELDSPFVFPEYMKKYRIGVLMQQILF